jgi:thioredoxin
MDVTTSSFETDVIERSQERTVVVDFWAAWCGPCRALGPVIEQAVADRNGALELVKVDIDAEPDLAERFAVRSIPAVKAFRRGQVVAEFLGAKPRAAVDAFLDGLTGPSEVSRLVEELREQGTRSDVVRAVEQERWEDAFELLIGELDGADTETREEVRRLMVALFGELGQDHPLSVQYRRRLATALF